MKKTIRTLCFLYVVFAFMSCHKNEPDDVHYLDNKLIEGTWYNKVARDSLVYKFKDNKLTTEFYAYINGMDELKPKNKEDFGNYFLTDSEIITPKRKDQNMLYRQPENCRDSLYIQTNNGYWYGFKKIKD
ncbi:MAG: hypothetical protein QM654_03270 [Dysgonamonadaceae bacterium]